MSNCVFIVCYHDDAGMLLTATRMSQNLVEGATEFHVKYGVDERVEKTVDVAEPDEEREQQWVKMTHSGSR